MYSLRKAKLLHAKLSSTYVTHKNQEKNISFTNKIDHFMHVCLWCFFLMGFGRQYQKFVYICRQENQVFYVGDLTNSVLRVITRRPSISLLSYLNFVRRSGLCEVRNWGHKLGGKLMHYASIRFENFNAFQGITNRLTLNYVRYRFENRWWKLK